ncbi:hypothetical protein PBT90_00075 [Algoriphagus halophytocola]|uniref:hypothetical protein n=1 Tax=Algoriphagus halophytocola TaxID=2991499 RepID=UPI0022DD3815|nr:hypothetical protein [Algoriphagus sp. TR-M9]WBL42359.1 hypothetical protein PBT90_16610 [Algoriphagus sp. TR-M9]WBL43104.1 hypothetical protein PBT90_00075 [Algoriphagus sp. TR-M9]
MLELQLTAIWITYSAILVMLWMTFRKLENRTKSLNQAMEEILTAQIIKSISPELRKKLGNEWMIQCTESGVKTPFKEFVIKYRREEAPHA